MLAWRLSIRWCASKEWQNSDLEDTYSLSLPLYMDQLFWWHHSPLQLLIRFLSNQMLSRIWSVPPQITCSHNYYFLYGEWHKVHYIGDREKSNIKVYSFTKVLSPPLKFFIVKVGFRTFSELIMFTSFQCKCQETKAWSVSGWILLIHEQII